VWSQQLAILALSGIQPKFLSYPDLAYYFHLFIYWAAVELRPLIGLLYLP
jgi:hypothetical protein